MKVRALEVEGDSGKTYRVSVDAKQVISCTCPSWKFQKLPIEERVCKHVAFLKSTLLARVIG